MNLRKLLKLWKPGKLPDPTHLSSSPIERKDQSNQGKRETIG